MSSPVFPDTTTGAVAHDRLRALGVASLLVPGDAGYPAAIAGFNLRVAHRPDLVVAASSAADIAHAVRVAGELDLSVTVLGLGHGIQRVVDGGILITTTGLASVTVDPGQRTARVGAGTQWQAVLDAATPHGLAPLCGSSPLVGVVGYLLGGGVGPVARSYGFAADHVRELEVVTGTGDIVRADPTTDPELFWALRGGKHGLGIVTEVVLDLVPLATVFAGGLFFPASQARAVLQTWAEWSATVSDSVTTSVAVLRLPPLPHLPEPLRGQTVVHVRVAIVTDDADAAERIVAPLRAVGPRLIDAVTELPYAQIAMVHQDPTEPMPIVEGGALLSDLDADAVDALLAAAGPQADVPLVMVELRRLGGALGREPRHPNAVPGRDAAYSVFVIGAPVPELFPVLPGIIRGVLAALTPWRSPRSLPNFLGSANVAADYRGAWDPETRARLDAVRAAVDPRGVFGFDPEGVN
ncbi:FAD-binding oxidoreductase [Galbitalea sp. SE-J8]|uniref:FAD-binding oxidoreductase n=1 Tax=Galbitalea sp. SE-J8 TaxID=3054952 RepID=UPI00259D1C4E|nr:FAD-binding oxidoreductase [Galbitalea sp. SE-J8]MDM4762850.1 FAD-binding oxidoreductase [Galbitalea sp. SE-J8]